MINTTANHPPLRFDQEHEQNARINSDKPANSTVLGLTKREHFAGLAMQAMLSTNTTRGNSHDFALAAVAFADDLLKALAEPRNG